MSLLPALLCLIATGAIAWVYIGIVYSLAARKGRPSDDIMLFYGLTGILINGVVYAAVQLTGRGFGPVRPVPADVPPLTMALIAALLLVSGIANYCQIITMSHAMRKGPNGVIWSITQSGMIFPFLMGILIFGVKLTPALLAGMLLIISSIVIFGVVRYAGGAKGEGGNWFLFAVFAFLSVGLNQITANLASYLPHGQEINGPFRTMMLMCGIALSWGVYVLPSRTRRARLLIAEQFRRALPYGASVAAVAAPAMFFLMFPGLDALKNLGLGSIGYPVAVTSCIVGFVVYSVVFLREKPTLLQIAGLLIALAGIVCISLG